METVSTLIAMVVWSAKILRLATGKFKIMANGRV